MPQAIMMYARIEAVQAFMQVQEKTHLSSVGAGGRGRGGKSLVQTGKGSGVYQGGRLGALWPWESVFHEETRISGAAWDIFIMNSICSCRIPAKFIHKETQWLGTNTS